MNEMPDTLWLTRAELKPGLPISQLLQPHSRDQRINASHQLVWSLFADNENRERDFLWRELKPGTFYTLSQRLPEDQHDLFNLWEPKALKPQIHNGDLLEFNLRVNATRALSRQGKDGKRSTHHDVVMMLKKDMKEGRHPVIENRRNYEHLAGLRWFEEQGKRYGFTFNWSENTEEKSDVAVLGYTTQSIPRFRKEKNKPIKLGILELSGTILITDPDQFLEKFCKGFGRAKAFGYGLMMIRRIKRSD